MSRYVWSCAHCDGLTSDPFDSRAEARDLANVHDLMWHGGGHTADVIRDSRKPKVVMA